MRESLGWVTNCADDKQCPQNWLEHAYDELPCKVPCHVCGRDVALVTDAGELKTGARGPDVLAFPVIPVSGGPACYTLDGVAPPSTSGPRPAPPPTEDVDEDDEEDSVDEPPRPQSPPSARPSVPPNGASKSREQPKPAAPKPAPKPAAKLLFAILSNGQTIKIDKDLATIGRSRTCDVVIPSAKVSRQHANISRADGKYFIEDLGSANGIWKNNEKVGRAEIAHGDQYVISEETITFEYR